MINLVESQSSVVTFHPTLEVKASGVFDTVQAAKQFNCTSGQNLHLNKYRTILEREKFINVFFATDGDGAYLEKCCGKGNVEVQISSSFLALQCISGWLHHATLEEKFVERDYSGFWNRTIYGTSSLLTLNEIEKIIQNPLKSVLVRNFGTVTQSNLHLLKELL